MAATNKIDLFISCIIGFTLVKIYGFWKARVPEIRIFLIFFQVIRNYISFYFKKLLKFGLKRNHFSNKNCFFIVIRQIEKKFLPYLRKK